MQWLTLHFLKQRVQTRTTLLEACVETHLQWRQNSVRLSTSPLLTQLPAFAAGRFSYPTEVQTVRRFKSRGNGKATTPRQRRLCPSFHSNWPRTSVTVRAFFLAPAPSYVRQRFEVKRRSLESTTPPYSIGVYTCHASYRLTARGSG